MKSTNIVSSGAIALLFPYGFPLVYANYRCALYKLCKRARRTREITDIKFAQHQLNGTRVEMTQHKNSSFYDIYDRKNLRLMEKAY